MGSELELENGKKIPIYETNFEGIKKIDVKKQNDILISIDAQSFTQQDYTYITQLAAILKDSGATGEFKLGNLKITINSLKTYEKDLIKRKWKM